MFLKVTPQRNGRKRLAIYESYREGRRTRQRTVRSLGYLDELEREHADPIAWGRALAERMTREKRAGEAPITFEVHPAQKIDKRGSNRKNLGCAIALAQYAALGIEPCLRNFRRGSSKGYDLNAVLRLLVTERIVSPGSKLSAWQNRGSYFFKSDFSDDDVYRALDELAEVKDRLVSAMNRSIDAATGRDMSCVYYDVTNYYFECDTEDGLRRRGFSKENRKGPIVQMGLLQDSEGIPITYAKFPGNTLDGKTMIPVLGQLKRDYGIERVVAVADKGLNNSDNIAAAVAKGDGFVFSQSLRGTKSDNALKSWALSEEGYRHMGEDFKIKSRQGHKTCHVKAADSASGRARDVRIPVKYVAFWSRKYQERARYDRAKVIERSRDLIASPSSFTAHKAHGSARFVEEVSFDKETGEVAEGSALSLNEDAIAVAEEADGYYLIVTSETDWDDSRIIDCYRELWRIEESFKITKSELRCRPVFVWKPEHIEAHFLTCYVALVILRLLQRATGLGCARIREELSLMSVTNFDSNWWVADHRTDATDLLVDALGLQELKLKNLTTKGIRQILAKAAKGGIPHKKKSSA